MKKNIFVLFFLLLSNFLFSNSAVICNATGWWDFPFLPLEEYGIKEFRYYIPPERVEYESNLSDKFIEDIKISKLLYFGQARNSIGPKKDLIFSNPSYRESVKKFLENGGTIIFDMGGIFEKDTLSFLNEIGVIPPKPGGIKGVSGEEIYPVISDEEKEKNHPILNFPNKLQPNERLKWCGTFVSWSENQIAPLRANADKNYAVMVIQENLCGKGRVIFNGVNNIFAHATRGEIYASNIFSYIFGQEIKRLPIADKRYKTKEEFTIWYKTPYSKFPVEENACEKNKVEKIDLKGCINEVIATNLLITNGKKGELKFKVDLDINIPKERVKIMELEFDGGRMPDRMPEKKEFIVGEGKTAIIWVSIDTTDIKDGDYSGDIVFKFEDNKEKRVRLNIKIYPIELQKINPIKLTVWDLVPGGSVRENMIGGPENWIKYHNDMKEHGVNVFHLSAYERPGIIFDEEGEIVKEDFTRFDSGIQFKSKEYQYLINMGSHNEEFSIERKKERVKYGSELWEVCYKNWVKSIIKHMKSIGLDYSQFAFYPYDEIGPEAVPHALKVYSLIKQVDKKARIFVTIVPSNFFETKKGLPVKEIAPYIDIWCPAVSYDGYWNNKWFSKKEFDKIIEFIKNKGEIWSYNVLTRGNSEIAAYTRYRLAPISSYRMGLGGCGFYGYNLWKNDSYMVVYPGENPITSYRWEAMREGINDLKYIEYLKNEIKKIKDEKKKKECQELIDQFLKEATEETQNAEIPYRYREKIIEKIIELKK
ncbi:MAG: DUF4091 domain-containing protein [Candidatus Omnitrophica bacterium]|nr:DUF4091 domain-containing protein [Candidatus Omnitrophota bacterium]MCM8802860.1 DUF4091 domain-containing protein [Candidatus Omnitrophota bacterium]